MIIALIQQNNLRRLNSTSKHSLKLTLKRVSRITSKNNFVKDIKNIKNTFKLH